MSNTKRNCVVQVNSVVLGGACRSTPRCGRFRVRVSRRSNSGCPFCNAGNASVQIAFSGQAAIYPRPYRTAHALEFSRACKVVPLGVFDAIELAGVRLDGCYCSADAELQQSKSFLNL